jgi:hypothetical protein
VRSLFLLLFLASCAPTSTHSSPDIAARHAEAVRITSACGVPAKTIIVNDDGSIHIHPKRTESYQRVDCVLAQLRNSKVIPNAPMSFVGNELPDGNVQ